MAPPVAGISDNRSPLAKALGRGIAWKRLAIEQGRLASVPLAVRWLPESVQEDAALLATRELTAVGRWSEEQLYTELGAGVHDLATQARTLVHALITPPPEGAELTPERVVPVVRGTDRLSAADELCQLLDADEIRYLHGEWLRFQRECSPITYAATPEAIEAVVDSLGKGTIPPSRLRTCEPDTLLSIAISMASRLSTLPRSSSSSTSPSSGTSEPSATPSDSPPSESATTGPSLAIDP